MSFSQRMSKEIAISVDQASKAYRLWDNPASRLTAPLLDLAARVVPNIAGLPNSLRTRGQRQYRDFWALKNISFQVPKGESMAIIGRNGSGKSTLLQLIAGTLQPSAGGVRVNGRVAALLELGSGFNPEFTGRENVYLNGMVLGLSRNEIDARYESIASFADIGDFIDQPVKIYSSGMVVRLAFAVCAHVDAEILIIDEALGVGDARFQLKCARTIDRFISEGRTLLFVSHDVSMVKRLCKRAVLLECGEQVYSGNPNDVVNLYSKLLAEGGTLTDLQSDIAALRKTKSSFEPVPLPPLSSTRPTAMDSVSEPDEQKQSDGVAALRLRIKALEVVLSNHPDNAIMSQQLEELLKNERENVQLSGDEFSYCGEQGQIHSAVMLDANAQPRSWFSSCEPVTVRMLVSAAEDVPEPIFALTIKNASGVEIYGTNTLYSKQPAPAVKAGTQREVDFCFDLNLMPGHYFISLGFTYFVGNELVVVHRRYDTIKFEIHGKDRVFGIANLQASISTRDPQGTAQPMKGAVK